tara:strand:+ start:1377 stop:2192 length:816 start_codon:yes stop_codon:yes gene_type:complete
VNPIRWITYLSLDAPLVALAWQELIAAQLGLSLAPQHRILIALSVWLGYTADRWFDGWRYHSTRSYRHQLYQRFRWPILATWIITLAAAFTIALRTLSQQELTNGLILMVVSIGITALIQKRILGQHPHLQKSLLTAALIASSALLFPLSFTTPSTQFLATLIPSLVALFTLFTLNCLLIHKWESPIDASHGESMQLTPSTQHRQFNPLWIATPALALLTAITNGPTIALPILLSLAALALIDRSANTITLDTRRTLADLALLTPIITLIT